ncbi:hypothetical protein GCM10027417_18530 [Glutamicibacter endophyticus]
MLGCMEQRGVGGQIDLQRLERAVLRGRVHANETFNGASLVAQSGKSAWQIVSAIVRSNDGGDMDWRAN